MIGLASLKFICFILLVALEQMKKALEVFDFFLDDYLEGDLPICPFELGLLVNQALKDNDQNLQFLLSS